MATLKALYESIIKDSINKIADINFSFNKTKVQLQDSTEFERQYRTIEIDGIKYLIILCRTAQQLSNNGLTATARDMQKDGIMAQMIIKKPKGKKHFVTNLYNTGGVSKPVAID